MAVKRTTVELDEELLERAKAALGLPTARATIEEALRQATERAESEFEERRQRQLDLLARLHTLGDQEVLASDEMWR